MNYVAYDVDGNLIGGFFQDLHPDHAGNHIEVAPNVRENWLKYRANSGRNGVEPAPEPVIDESALKRRLIEEIDSFIASVYARWMRFEAEYREREAAAIAFVSSGYVGDPGIWVSAFATSAGKTNMQSADLIIAQAAGLRAALQNLGALRMQKYSILSATSPASANSVYNTIISQANAIAAAIS
jgi:hypothetical protein